MSRFTYLYLHTHFSRDGGPASPAQWCRAAAELGYTSLGVADRGPLAGFPAFSKAARETGLQPVYGMEAGIVLPLTSKEGETRVLPVAFFACDREGMNNLARLASVAYACWPTEEQPVAWEVVAEHSAGLALVLLPQDGDVEEGVVDPGGLGDKIRECFGEWAYVGLVHADAETATAAEQMRLPVIALPTARYIRPEDKLSYDALQVARRRVDWVKETQTQVSGPGTQHLLSPDEVAGLYAPYTEALENAARLAEMCAGVGYLDELATATYQGAMPAERSRLRKLAEERLLQRLQTNALPESVSEWLEDELAAYERQNALPAWSALASICDKAGGAKSRPATPLGAPLGTADGSLLAYAFGISPTNPVD
ncbi:MAG: PHP domain-containing protein, partial [Chloroflexota bacterium]|nr:PHP domain-containing protein [Chloroflexota bacterium]